jgi:phytanoyl-CoA hydroxylase
MSMTALGPAEIGRRLYQYSRVHTPIPSPDAITPEHMRQYWTDGFIAVENVFDPREVKDAIEGLLHLIRGGNPEFGDVQLEEAAALGVDPNSVAPDDREQYVRKLMWFADADPRLSAMAYHAKLTGICQRLIGSTVRMAQEMALLKPPRIGREKPWHQDNAYFNFKPLDGVIGTWTALDAATIDNGCMHVIPGSHLKGPQPHFHDRDCQLPDDMIDVAEDVVVPLKPGGVLFFHGLLFHGTPPNQSAAKRRALQFHYTSTQCTTMTDDEHAATFHEHGTYSGCRLAARRIAERVF